MKTTIEEQVQGQVVVLVPKGRLISGPDVADIHDRVRELVQSGSLQVVVDFSNVDWFGSAMLGILAACYTTLKNAGGGLCLCGLSEKSHAVLAVARLNEVFEQCETVEQAVASSAVEAS